MAPKVKLNHYCGNWRQGFLLEGRCPDEEIRDRQFAGRFGQHWEKTGGSWWSVLCWEQLQLGGYPTVWLLLPTVRQELSVLVPQDQELNPESRQYSQHQVLGRLQTQDRSLKFQLLNTKLVIISVFTLRIVLTLNSKLCVVYFINCKLYFNFLTPEDW